MAQNIQRRWIAFCLVCYISVCEVAVTDDVKKETECYAAHTFLKPNCGVSSGLVISIDWNATLFGQSTLECGHDVCCPGYTVCTVLVKDTDHFEDDHWDELNDCNGQTSCEVQVERVGLGHGCDKATDYETMTYRCVAQVVSTSESASSLASERDTPSWSSPYKTASTESPSVYSDTSDSSPSITPEGFSTTVSQSEATDAGEKTSVTYSTPEPSDGDNIGIIIGVTVGILLVIVILIVIAVVCYRRKKKASQPTDVLYRESIKRPRDPDDIDKTYSHVSRQSISDKNTYEAVHYKASSASDFNKHSDNRKPEPPPSRSPSKGHNSQPWSQTPNGLPEGPADAVYAEPLDVKLDKEDTSAPVNKSDADYSYTSFNKQPNIGLQSASGDTEGTGGSKNSVVYADILHAQNEEYADGDSNDMEIEDNDLYSLTEDNGDDKPEDIPAGQSFEDGDDDDMEIMDNDVYNLSDMGEDDVSQSANHQPEDDDDMVVAENDVYNIRMPGDDTEANSV